MKKLVESSLAPLKMAFAPRMPRNSFPLRTLPLNSSPSRLNPLKSFPPPDTANVGGALHESTHARAAPAAPRTRWSAGTRILRYRYRYSGYIGTMVVMVGKLPGRLFQSVNTATGTVKRHRGEPVPYCLKTQRGEPDTHTQTYKHKPTHTQQPQVQYPGREPSRRASLINIQTKRARFAGRGQCLSNCCRVLSRLALLARFSVCILELTDLADACAIFFAAQ